MGQSTSDLFEQFEERRTHQARRSQLEIQMDILRVVHEGAYLPTQIMYRANLAWTSLQSSLSSLVGIGLLERMTEGSKRNYQLTVKGIDVLASFTRIIETVNERRSLRSAP